MHGKFSSMRTTKEDYKYDGLATVLLSLSPRESLDIIMLWCSNLQLLVFVYVIRIRQDSK